MPQGTFAFHLADDLDIKTEDRHNHFNILEKVFWHFKQWI